MRARAHGCRNREMDFSTAEFWYSLIPALLLIWLGNVLLRRWSDVRRRYNKLLMLVLSLVLLGLASWQTLCIFLTVTLTAWVVCKWGLRLGQGGRRALLWCTVPVLLLPLLYYKYADFICNGIAGQQWDTLRDLIIPIGISFYTFQIIGFCIDTLLRDEPMPRFVDYMNFGSFFPQIVAGPIERRSDLLPQVQRMELALRASDFEVGLPYVILGLFFKMALADNIATAFWADYAGHNAWMVWLNNLLFTFRIYFDFAGYGLTAYGIARCLGITLRMNFISPYTAGNITEFWRRWHTSLTLWFRDYIYFALGGSRTKRWALNILIVFTISGIWHGAGWNFVMWGAFAGVAMVVHRVFRNLGGKLPSLLGWGMTFCMMVFVWMFFYDAKPEMLEHHLHVIAEPANYDLRAFVQELVDRQMAGTLPGLFLLLSFAVVLVEYLSGRRYRDEPYRLLLSPVACGVLVFLLVVLNTSVQNQFIYFAF